MNRDGWLQPASSPQDDETDVRPTKIINPAAGRWRCVFVWKDGFGSAPIDSDLAEHVRKHLDQGWSDAEFHVRVKTREIEPYNDPDPS